MSVDADLDDDEQSAMSGAQLCTLWLDEIQRAERVREPWMVRCKKVVARYEDERSDSENEPIASKRRRYNIFWSNVETLKPAIYARTPKADISRRYKDADAVGRVASELIERALNYSADAYDFDGRMKACRDQFLLVARATAWVRYTATFKPATVDDLGEDAETLENAPEATGQVSNEPEEVVDTETVEFDHVSYEDFLHGAGRTWAEIPWVARRVYMSRKELVARFGDKKGKGISLDFTPDGCSDAPDKDDHFKKAVVFELWDRTEKQVLWVAKGYTSDVLDRRDDPLGLQDFFPCPPPMLGTTGTKTILPIPDFAMYQDQADEIDDLTMRIRDLSKSLKVRGFYAGQMESKLANLLDGDNGTMVPIDSYAAMKDNGGIKGLVEWLPIEQVVEALRECITTRKQLIDDIYQITGISDIMRGDTDASETATAQGIKATWGSSRVRDRQKEMARFARDILRIKAQVIASKFQAQTLTEMTDIKLLTAAEKQQIGLQLQLAQQAAAQQAAAAPPPPPGQPPAPPQASPPPIAPDKLKLMDEPTWDDVMALMGSKTLLRFRIDVESDASAEPDEQEEKQRAIEFVEAVGKFVANSMPVIEAQPALLPVILQSLQFLVRRFRVGRDLEDVIDQACAKLEGAGAQPPPQKPQKGPDPQAQQVQAQAALLKAHAAVGAIQVDQQHLQLEAQRAGMEHQVDMAHVGAENYRTQTDAHAAITTAAIDAHSAAQQHMQEVIQKASDRRAVATINDDHPLRAPTP